MTAPDGGRERLRRFDTAHLETRSPHIGQDVGAELSCAIPHYG